MKNIVIVTGAATGIGLETAKYLADRHTVVAVYNNTPIPESDLEIMGGNSIKCDVSNYAQCVKMAELASQFGNIYGLVHCAALNPTPAPSVQEMEPEFWLHIIRTNLDSAFYLAKALLPFMLANNKGSIVFVSSTAGRNGFSTAGGSPGHAKTAYATSKAGIIAFTHGLAKEVAGLGIRVNCMACGPIDTRMLPNKEATAARVPMGRIGEPYEAAVAISFLLDQATYTTGCTLDVCGGQYMN